MSLVGVVINRATRQIASIIVPTRDAELNGFKLNAGQYMRKIGLGFYKSCKSQKELVKLLGLND